MGIFLGIQNNLKILGSAYISQPLSSVSKVKPDLVCSCSFKGSEIQHGIFGVYFWPRVFLGFVGSPRDFLGF